MGACSAVGQDVGCVKRTGPYISCRPCTSRCVSRTLQELAPRCVQENRNARSAVPGASFSSQQLGKVEDLAPHRSPGLPSGGNQTAAAFLRAGLRFGAFLAAFFAAFFAGFLAAFFATFFLAAFFFATVDPPK